jgi:hypothetical protein
MLELDLSTVLVTSDRLTEREAEGLHRILARRRAGGRGAPRRGASRRVKLLLTSHPSLLFWVAVTRWRVGRENKNDA